MGLFAKDHAKWRRPGSWSTLRDIYDAEKQIEKHCPI